MSNIGQVRSLVRVGRLLIAALNKLKKMSRGNIRQYSMLIALVAIVIFLQITTKGALLKPMNVSNIVFQNAYVVILAVGMLMCILTGGNIDLSVGSVLAVVMACAGTGIMTWKLDPYITMIACLAIGILIGAWQGFWISYVGIPPFIVTLSGMLLFRGLTLSILNGLTLSNFPQGFLQFSTGFIPDFFGGITLFDVTLNATAMLVGVLVAAGFCVMQVVKNINRKKKGYETDRPLALIFKLVLVSAALIWFFSILAQYRGVPTVLITLGIILICYTYLTGNTVIGRHLYALGGNQKAAWLSGVNTKRLLFLAYVNMGFLAAVAGLVCASRFNSAFPLAGQGYELDAIAACFIGGASASGGIGTVSGALIGALIMGTLNNGMIIMGVNQYMQQVVKGLVLLVAVAFDVISKNRFGFEAAARFAAWVKELLRPGSREKPIRTRIAGLIIAIAGALVLCAGIFGFILHPSASVPGGLMDVAAGVVLNPVEAVVITFGQTLQYTVVAHRVLITVLGGVTAVAGVLLRVRRSDIHPAAKASENVKS